MMSWRARAAWLFLVLLVAVFPPRRAAAAMNRWAIIGSEDVRESGVVDLLTAELSTAQGMQLVERAAIDDVLKEQALSALGAAGGAAARVRMGQLLRADALALLSVDQAEGKALLSVIVCDCSHGARLAVVSFALPDVAPAATAKEIADIITRTRARFPSGVQQVVGVSPFISQDLSHEFDRYQVAFCRLLQGVLAAQPGTAVIEVEEARALHEELAGSMASVAERRVPIMVTGEYRVTRDEAGKPVALVITRLSDGARELKTA